MPNLSQFQDNTRGGAGKGHLEVNNQFEVNIPNLHPFSIYKIEVKALPNTDEHYIPEELNVIGETAPGIPNVSPLASSSRIPTGVKEDYLKFYWGAPQDSKCEHFNAKLDGYHVILKGLSAWNKEYRHEDQVPGIGEISKEFHGLLPFSNYNLYVYVLTASGDWNPDLFQTIYAETLASENVPPPRDLTVTTSEDGYHLTWLPPYPPTGVVTKYSLRWKSPGSEFWLKSVEVLPGSSLCHNSQEVSQSTFDKKICHTLPSSEFDMDNVTFQVSAFNAGFSKNGQWSALAYPEVGKNGQFGQNVGIIIIAIIAAVVLISIIVLISVKCIKRNNRYKNVPNYSRASTGNPAGGAIALNNRNSSGSGSILPPPWTPPSPRRQPSINSNSVNYNNK